MRYLGALLCALSVSLVAGRASALTQLTFDDIGLQHGSVVDSQYSGVSISAENFNKAFGIAAAFDTGSTGTQDPDLESASGGGTLWSGGNLQGVALGKALIIQENDQDCGSGVCDVPDDEGLRAAGRLVFDFDSPISSFGFDLIDLEDVTLEAGDVTFFDGGLSETVDFADLAAGLVIGDNTANRFDAITAESLGLSGFDSVAILLGGSGAVDNVTFESVPEPTTLLLLGTAAAMGLGRRRARGGGASA